MLYTIFGCLALVISIGLVMHAKSLSAYIELQTVELQELINELKGDE